MQVAIKGLRNVAGLKSPIENIPGNTVEFFERGHLLARTG